MKKIKLIAPIIATLLFLEACKNEKPLIIDVSPQEAFEIIEKNKSSDTFVIIDLRTPEEYREGHIAGATNINFYSKDFTEKIGDLSRNKTYLIYCHSGARSGITKDIMKNLGFKRVLNLKGGIAAWTYEKLPVIK